MFSSPLVLADDGTEHRAWRPESLSDTLSLNNDGWPRFMREARIIAAVKHVHLVPVYQVSEANGVVYLAMEYLAGGTLPRSARALIRRGSR